MIYLAYNIVDQDLGWAQLGCPSVLSWDYSRIWTQVQDGLQVDWSRVALTGMSSLYSHDLSFLCACWLCRALRKHVEQCKMSWGLGLKVEQHHFGHILLAKLSYETSPNSKSHHLDIGRRIIMANFANTLYLPWHLFLVLNLLLLERSGEFLFPQVNPDSCTIILHFRRKSACRGRYWDLD